jgi:hypothetical protein
VRAPLLETARGGRIQKSALVQWARQYRVPRHIVKEMTAEVEDAADPKAFHFAQAKVFIGLGRIFPLYYRSSTSYHIHEHIRYLFF